MINKPPNSHKQKLITLRQRLRREAFGNRILLKEPCMRVS